MSKMTYNNLMKIKDDGIDFVNKYRSDSALRAKVDANPKQALAEMGVAKLPDNMQVELKFNDDNTYYFVIPVNPNLELNEENLNQINAAKGSVSTGGSASSFGTMGTCISSISSASTTGSASTAGTS